MGAGEKLAFTLSVTAPSAMADQEYRVLLRWPDDNASYEVFERTSSGWTYLEDSDANYVHLPGTLAAGESRTWNLGVHLSPGVAIDPGASYNPAATDTDVPITAGVHPADPQGRISGPSVVSATYQVTALPLDISANWPRSVVNGKAYLVRVGYHNRSDTAYPLLSQTRPEAGVQFQTKGSPLKIRAEWSVASNGPWHDAKHVASPGEGAYPPDLAYAYLAPVPVPAHSSRTSYVRLTVTKAVSSPMALRAGFWDTVAGYTFGMVYDHEIAVRQGAAAPGPSSDPQSKPPTATRGTAPQKTATPTGAAPTSTAPTTEDPSDSPDPQTAARDASRPLWRSALVLLLAGTVIGGTLLAWRRLRGRHAP